MGQKGETTLHIAAGKGREDMLAWLLQIDTMIQELNSRTVRLTL